MASRCVSLRDIESLRAHRWRTASARQIGTERSALRLIRELGFVLLMRIRGTELPSVQTATREQWAWWDWKQTLPGRRACYYAKVLRQRGTFIAWEWFPQFYAVYAYTRPYWRQYRDGLLDPTEKRILDLLEEHGPLMTRELRLLFGERSKQNTRLVKSALTQLQRRFLVTAAGGDTAGWSHHRWDLVERWVPARLLAAATGLTGGEARTDIVRQFVQNIVVTTPADIAWLFGWERREVDGLVAALLQRGEIQTASAPDLGGEVLVPKPWRSGRSRGRRSQRGG
jgi:hypothetical protein